MQQSVVFNSFWRLKRFDSQNILPNEALSLNNGSKQVLKFLSEGNLKGTCSLFSFFQTGIFCDRIRIHFFIDENISHILYTKPVFATQLTTWNTLFSYKSVKKTNGHFSISIVNVERFINVQCFFLDNYGPWILKRTKWYPKGVFLILVFKSLKSYINESNWISNFLIKLLFRF